MHRRPRCSSIRKAVHLVLGIDSDPRRAQAKAMDAFLRFGIYPEEAEEGAIMGTPQQYVERLGQYVTPGVSHFIIELRPPYDYEGLELFAREVIPAFR